MGGGGRSWSWSAIVAPPLPTPTASVGPVSSSSTSSGEREEHWRQFDNSVNAVSFGFVATAVLICMFLAMALFERFLRPRSTPSAARNHGDLHPPIHGKLDYPSPKMTIYAGGLSVLMPGEEIPTFIANPAPVPCPTECIAQPP